MLHISSSNSKYAQFKMRNIKLLYALHKTNMEISQNINTDSRLTKPIFGTFLYTQKISNISLDMINLLSYKGDIVGTRTDISWKLTQGSQNQIMAHSENLY